MAAGALATLGLLAWATQDNLNQWDGPQTLLRCLPEFLLGTLLYSAFRSGLAASLLSSDLTMAGIVLAILLLLHTGGPDLLAVPLFALLILAAVANRGRAAGALNIRPLVWLGDVSYSLYLIHGFVQYAATQALDHYGAHERADLPIGVSLALLALMLAVCFAGAHLSYRGIEIGCRKHLRALLGSDGAAKPKAAAAGNLVGRPASA